MKRASSIRGSLICSIVLLLGAVALGIAQHSRIQSLREEHRQLSRQLTVATSDTPDHSRTRVRERSDPAAEASRTMTDLLRFATAGNATGSDLMHRTDTAELADRIQAMNPAELREALNWILKADSMEPAMRTRFFYEFLNRLARDHPHEVVAMVTGLQQQPPDWLVTHSLSVVLQTAVSHWAELQPLAAWDWARERRRSLDEKAAANLRTTVFKGIARKNPELVLQLADDEGIEGPRFLIWKDQSTDEKLASFIALRKWCAVDDSRRPVLTKSIRELTLNKTWGQAIPFEQATGWIDRARPDPEDIRFLTDRSKLDLTYYIDSVETGRWIDWLCQTFPKEWTRLRIAGLFESHRTADAARKWLATQPEDHWLRAHLPPQR